MEDEQIHPLHDTDKEMVDSLIVKSIPDDVDLINLARLIKRYQNFIGETDLKADLEKILSFWKMSEESLFSKTRLIWSDDFNPNNRSEELVGSGFDTSN